MYGEASEDLGSGEGEVEEEANVGVGELGISTGERGDGDDMVVVRPNCETGTRERGIVDVAFAVVCDDDLCKTFVYRLNDALS